MKDGNDSHDASYPFEHESTYAPSGPGSDHHNFGRHDKFDDPAPKPYEGEYVPSGHGDGVMPKPHTETEYPGEKNSYEYAERPHEKKMGY